jgi:hypothetical protein
MRNYLKLDHPDELPLAVERAGEPPSRLAVARSMQNRWDVPEFDRCEIGRDAYPHSHREVGIGAGVVPSIWALILLHRLRSCPSFRQLKLRRNSDG